MKLYFSRRTWYFLLLCAAAASMAGGIAALAGADYTFLEMCSFCGSTMAILFLTAEKDNPLPLRRLYFLAFLAQILSYIFGGVPGLFFSSIGWPLLFFAETRRGAPAQKPLSVCLCTEVLHLALLLITLNGADSLRFSVNLSWVLLTIVRGWGALVLYRFCEQKP